jgi:hypothetical protein
MVKVLASKAGAGDFPEVRVELRGGNNGMKLHASAIAVLTAQLPAPQPLSLTVGAGTYEHSIDEVYRDILFHGEFLKAIESVDGISEDGLVATLVGGRKPSEWMENPPRSDWLGDPLIMDGAFQLMILWTRKNANLLSLPNYVGRYRQYVSDFPTGTSGIVIRARRKGVASAGADMEFLDERGRLLATIEDYECTMSPSLDGAFKARSVN